MDLGKNKKASNETRVYRIQALEDLLEIRERDIEAVDPGIDSARKYGRARAPISYHISTKMFE